MKLGILGSGKIVPAFLKAAALLEEIEVIAICSSKRSYQKAKRLAKEQNIHKVYDDYAQMLSDQELEVIYLALPNHLHYESAKKALLCGKHVICEKPFCESKEELEELIRLSRERKLFLFEAISNQYLPNYQKLRECLPRLGKIHMVELNFSQYSSRYDAFLQGEILPVFDPEKAGGALMDLNVYNLHFVTGLFGKPLALTYLPNMQKGIDSSGLLTLKYPEFACSLIAAKDSAAPCRISIQGEKGCIFSDCRSNSFEHFSLMLRGKEPVFYAENACSERLFYELKAFTDMYLQGDFEQKESCLRQSLLVQELLEKARTEMK